MSSVDLPRCQLEAQGSHPLVACLLAWVSRVGPFWAASVVGHLALFVVVTLVLGTVHVTKTLLERDVRSPIEMVNTVLPPPVDFDRRRIDEPVLMPPPLEVLPPAIDLPTIDAPPEKGLVDTPSVGTATGDPFNGPPGPNRSTLAFLIDSRSAVPRSDGGGKPGERVILPGKNDFGTRGELFGKPVRGRRNPGKSAVIGALDWFKRHQAPDGSWGLSDYSGECKDSTCTGAGKIKSDVAATAFAVLPYLAAGFTHQTKGDYQKTVYGGLFSLVKNQAADGGLGATQPGTMYAHGLATICLCEAFGMTKDQHIGAAAQAALKFIESAQNKDDGGWRYAPGQPGDTSVTGWQLMALKSGQMAGLAVDRNVIELGKKYLKSASSKSQQGGLFGYLPESGTSATMTAVGLLCTQYLGAKRDDPALAEGRAYLMKLLPDIQRRNSYYWYYATQVMHNTEDADWDTWNRAMRHALLESQVKEGCAAGSWDPQKPTTDTGSDTGGRIMTTSLAALTLEVYYRYLPLYTLDKKDQARRPE
jgi:hypothetical protein